MDNTLYLKGQGPNNEVEVNITKYVIKFLGISNEEAENLRKNYQSLTVFIVNERKV